MTPFRYSILALSFVVLALLAATAHRWLLTIEQPLSEAVRGDALLDAFAVITLIGGTEVAIAAAVGLAAATWRRCRSFAVAYPTTLLVGAMVNVGLKEVIGRPRPPNPATGVAFASFPSGHTIQATLLLGLLPPAVYLITRRPQLFRVTAALSVAGIVAVGASRVYLGAHWPTDIIGGVLVGAGLIIMSERLFLHPRTHGLCACGQAEMRREGSSG